MTWHFDWMVRAALVASVAGCGDDTTSPGDTDTDTDTDTGTGTTATTDGPTTVGPPMTSTTGQVDSTGQLDSTGVATEDSSGSSGSGGMASRGRARLVFIDATDDVYTLRTVDYDDGPLGDPVLVHAPLGPGVSVSPLYRVSPDRRWLSLREVHSAPESHVLSVVDMTDPAFPNPVPINVAPAPNPGWATGEEFSPASTHVAFLGGPDGAGPFDLFLVELAGGPSVPVRINPQPGTGGSVSSGFLFSPDGSRIAYIADLDGAGTNEIYVQDADTSDPGIAVQVSAGGGSSPHFSGDGSVVYYTRDVDADGIAELHAVDISGPPSAPQVYDPGDVGTVKAMRWAPDGRGLAYWTGDDASVLGDLVFVPFVGAGFGTPVTLNVAPGVGVLNSIEWSPASTHIVFSAEEDGPLDGWLVAVEDGTASIPVRVNDPLPPGAEVTEYAFDPTGSSVYYFVSDTGTTLFHAPIEGDVLGARTQLSPASTSADGAVLVSEDGTRVTFSAVDGGVRTLYVSDLRGAAPSEGVALSPTRGPAAETWFTGAFAPEGEAIFYVAFGVPEHDPWLFAGSPNEPGVANPVVDTGRVQNARLFPLP